LIFAYYFYSVSTGDNENPDYLPESLIQDKTGYLNLFLVAGKPDHQ